MKIIPLAVGAAVALSSGLAFAQTAAPPKQPLPYSQLNAYMKASPKARTSRDWWSGQAAAPTGSAANTSATTTAGSDVRSAPDAASSSTSSATSVNPPSLGGETGAAPSPGAAPSSPPTAPVDTPTPGAVNPAPSATPPSAIPPK